MEVATSTSVSRFDQADTRIRVELKVETNLAEVRTNIDTNTALRRVDLVFYCSSMQLDWPDVEVFIESICRNPELQELKLTSGESRTYVILPVSTVAAVLDLATDLRKLEVGPIQLAGTEADFTQLQCAFQNHSSLKELFVSGWLSEETRIAMTQDALARSIASSRSLETVSYQPSFTFGGITDVTVGMLCTLPALHTLHISKCNLTDRNVVAMAVALQDNRALIELNLCCRLGAPGSQAIANCLRSNNTLEALIIHNTSFSTESDTTDSSVDSITSPCEAVVLDSHMAEIGNALKANTSLKTLAMHGPRLSHQSQTTFVDVLRENYSLQTLSLVALHSDLRDEVEMYTQLNRCGRAKLFRQGTSNQEWIHTMTLVSDNLNCIFYLLSKRPSLCDVGDSKRKRGILNNASGLCYDRSTKRGKPAT